MDSSGNPFMHLPPEINARADPALLQIITLQQARIELLETRIEELLAKQICTKQVGIAEQTGQVTFESLQKYTDTFRDRGISDFYFLDYMYLVIWLNRQWAGAESIATLKTPLTLYPYVHYGLRQSVESKLQSRFVRDVISTAMPQWRDVPFFHELPPEEINHFAQSYPTYWDFGRADEIAELAVSN